MPRTLSPQQAGETVKLDYLSSLFIALGFSLALLEAIVHVQNDMYITVASLIFAVMTVGSLILHGALCGGNELAHDFGLGNAVRLLTFLFGIVGVYITQVIIIVFVRPMSTAFSSVADSTAFYVSASMGEEMFFRYFLQTWIQQFINIAIKSYSYILIKVLGYAANYLSVSGAFMLYHIAVYGTSIQGLAAVFASSLILCIALGVTKRICVTQAIHGWVDVMAAVASVLKV
jgi:hypothetical protein